MHIVKIELENIRCFEKLVLDLTSAKGVRSMALVLGDNGTGKTTLLRSIAMGLCDQTSAAGLLRELYGDWVRSLGEHKSGVIRITLVDESNTGATFEIETTIEKQDRGDTIVSQRTEPEDFPWNDIFVCGYGSARRAYGSKDYSEYAADDAMYTLFQYDSPLQNAELALRRLNAAGVPMDDVVGRINDILMLESGSVKLTQTGIQITGPWGSFVPLGGVADGYGATLAWIVDMLGWSVLYDPSGTNWQLSGIVLLDEIEQHLHPKWQRTIMTRLGEQFPRIQFIATTHSPMCAIGTTAFSDEECGLFLLHQGDEAMEGSGPHSPPRHLRADQVLTGFLFGLYTSGDDATQAEIEEYAQLARVAPRTPAQEQRLQQLHDSLDQRLGAPETQLQRSIQEALYELLVERGLTAESEAVTLETKRQLLEVFGEAGESK